MYYALEVKVEKDDEWYVAICDELELTGRGTTRDNACEELKEVIALFFEMADNQEAGKYLSRLKQIPPPNFQRKLRVDISPPADTSLITGGLELAYA